MNKIFYGVEVARLENMFTGGGYSFVINDILSLTKKAILDTVYSTQKYAEAMKIMNVLESKHVLEIAPAVYAVVSICYELGLYIIDINSIRWGCNYYHSLEELPHQAIEVISSYADICFR